MDSRKIILTASARTEGNLNLSSCGKDFFPADAIGGSSRKKGVGVPIIIKAQGLPQPIETDIPTDSKTGKPRWIFRERSWVKEFICLNNLVPGSVINIERLNDRIYKVVSDNNDTEKDKTECSDKDKRVSVQDTPESLKGERIRTKQANNEKTLLKIGYNRTCDCKGNRINCLTPKEWLKCQLGVWQFTYERRDVRDKMLHPATFPIALARKVIDLFSHRGELILDPFVGSGTTIIAAQDVGRNAVGFDLQKKYVELSQHRLEKNSSMFGDTKQIAIFDDAINIPNYIPSESVALIFTSPPYANLLNRERKNKSRRDRKNEQLGKIEQYSQDPRDLGTMAINDYTKAMGDIFENLFSLLRPKGHCVINVPDMWWENKRITIHVSLIEELRKRGYELRNIIIWDRTNIVNGIGIFGWPSNYITMGVTFEYLLDFWRPSN